MKSECLLNYDVLSVGEEHHLYLLVRVQGAALESQRERVPLNLSLVIDRSGSMRGDKLEYVKQAAKELVRSLRDDDLISVVAYDEQVEVPFPHTNAKNKDVVRSAIDGLTSRGTTNLSGGWLQGCQFVSEALNEKQVNRVLLLSDGLANQGVTEPVQLEAMARQKRAAGVTTTTMGVGRDFNEDLLSRMAAEGGGAFYFIDNPDQAPSIFQEELQDLNRVVGQNLTIAIKSESPVRAVQQLYDFPMEQHAGELTYRLGDIYAEEQRYQVFELTLAPLEKGTVKLGTIRVAFDAIDEEGVEHEESAYELSVEAKESGEIEVALPNVDVQKLALIQKAARAREKAVEFADRREFKQAAEALRAAAQTIEESGIDDETLETERGRLLEEAIEMDRGPERYDAEVRKMHSMKRSHSHRHERSELMISSMHTRHKQSFLAEQGSGTPPARISWGRHELDLGGEAVRIGSAPDNQIVLQGDEVADYHAVIEAEGGDWYLRPLAGKSAPTFANAGAVSGRFRLSAGDVLSIGRTFLHLV
ncbi:MAG: VWA domain-containing protein [Anaerolineales bacterium]|nr:VWA domain-containing protein [Anaerolineales bacterium]